MQPLRKFLPFLFAVATLLACVLACRPGFSPDGRRIVFSVVDETAKTTFLRVYDRKTEKITTLRSLPWLEGSNAVYCAASWSPSGAQIGMIVSAEKGLTNGRIEIIDAETGGQIRSTGLDRNHDAMVLCPPVFTKNFLVFGGAFLTKFNLRNGHIDHEQVDTNANVAEVYILNNQNGLHYYSELKGDAGTNGNGIEFGTIDVDRLVRIPEQTFAADMGGLPDVSPDGKRIALWKKEPGSAIQIWTQSKLEKTIPVPETNSLTLGNLVWSKDQKVIFAPAFQDPEEPTAETKSLISLLEIPLDGSAIRRTGLGSSTIKPDQATSSFQLSLAPDGKALALGTPLGSLDKASQPTAFYLIDLSNSNRTAKAISFRTGTNK